jgi:hypothetical protein
MEPATSGSTSFWKTAPGIITAVAGFLTAVAALVGSLAAVGVIGPTSSPPTTTTSTGTSSSTPTSTPVPPTTVPLPEPELASVDLVYTGDQYGCALHLTFEIDEQTVIPTGNRFSVRNLSPGARDYSVRGTISCPQAGVCTASGAGVIDVADGREYYVSWLVTTAGGCDVALNG